jgi:membrane carboxypeptidase/penicillin-binding protein
MQLQDRTGHLAGPAALAEAMGVRRRTAAAAAGPVVHARDQRGVAAGDGRGVRDVRPPAASTARRTRCVSVRQPEYAGHGGARGRAHRDIDLRPAAVRQVLPSPVADTVTSVLSGSSPRDRPQRRPGAARRGQDRTVQDYSSAWFAGYTPDLAAAVWMGDPRGGYRFPLRDVEVAGQRYAQVYGGGVPAQTWSALVRGALQGSPPGRSRRRRRGP